MVSFFVFAEKLKYRPGGVRRYNALQFVQRGAFNRVNGLKMLQKLVSSLVAHTFDFIERGAAHALCAERAVVSDRKPMGFLLNAADERKHSGYGRNAEFPAIGRDQAARAVMVYPKRYLAIDQGPIVVMIENYRTGLLWKLFMSHPDVQEGLKKLGFAESK